jgi:hypothetical protein
MKKGSEKRRCRICGCTDDDCRQCIEKTGEPCYWVEEDLCSACIDEAYKKERPDANTARFNLYIELQKVQKQIDTAAGNAGGYSRDWESVYSEPKDTAQTITNALHEMAMAKVHLSRAIAWLEKETPNGP